MLQEGEPVYRICRRVSQGPPPENKKDTGIFPCDMCGEMVYVALTQQLPPELLGREHVLACNECMARHPAAGPDYDKMLLRGILLQGLLGETFYWETGGDAS